MLSYNWQPSSLSKALPFLVLILMLLGGSIWLAVKRNRYGFFLCWFWITLAPTSSIFPINDLIFEQRMYLPLAGLVGAAVMAAYDGMIWLHKKTERNVAVLGITAWGVIVMASVAGTLNRNSDYAQGELYMWQDVLSKQPENLKALSLVGKGLAQLGKTQAALEYYNKALTIDPDNFLAHNDLANLYTSLGDIDMAETHLREMIRISPKVPLPYLVLAKLMIQQREILEAILLMEKAVEYNPKLFNIRAQLAQIYFKTGQLDKATPHLKAYLAEHPDNGQAQKMLQTIKARR